MGAEGSGGRVHRAHGALLQGAAIQAVVEAPQPPIYRGSGAVPSMVKVASPPGAPVPGWPPPTKTR